MQALLTSPSITVPLTRAPHRRMPALPGSVPPRPKGLWQFSGASIDIHPIPFLFCSLMSNSHNVRATTARPLRKTSKGRSGPHGTTSRVAVPSPPPAGQGESLIHRGDEPQLTWDELFGLR